jgi:hypothetical protein
MYCRRCDYILDGIDSHRCPECGRDFDPTDPKTFATAPRLQRVYMPILRLIGRAVAGALIAHGATVLALLVSIMLLEPLIGPNPLIYETSSIVLVFLSALLLSRKCHFRPRDLFAAALVLVYINAYLISRRWGAFTAACAVGTMVTNLFTVLPLLVGTCVVAWQTRHTPNPRAPAL